MVATEVGAVVHAVKVRNSVPSLIILFITPQGQGKVGTLAHYSFFVVVKKTDYKVHFLFQINLHTFSYFFLAQKIHFIY